MEKELSFHIPALMGVESVVAHELKRLGLRDVRAENGRVCCAGTIADIPRLNINLRTGARVLLCLGQFDAKSFEELFDGCAALPWEDFIPKDGQFPVKGHCISSKLYAESACQSILKKAVAKRLGSVYGCRPCPRRGPYARSNFLF